MDLSFKAAATSMEFDGLRATRKIASQRDLTEFIQSQAYHEFITFIDDLNEAIKGKPITDDHEVSKNVKWAVNVLNELDSMIDEHPPEADRGRFGNPAFKNWLHAVRQMAAKEMSTVVQEDYVMEVTDYFIASFGDFFRIDYGTGHEAHFAVWLMCLFKLDIFDGHQDRTDAVLCVFNRYIKLMRRLQKTYWLEPAGSHGVWGLDDYHFLPFLWGAAQLIDHPVIKPKSILDEDILEEFHEKYMYLACIRAIMQVKTAGLAWNSPMLNDISAVKTWEKVNQGLIRMYKVEVLGKLPIMQHMLFGRLLAFEPSSPQQPGQEPPSSQIPIAGPMHIHSMRGDCCGNPIPSVYAAAQDEKARNQRKLRTLPFD